MLQLAADIGTAIERAVEQEAQNLEDEARTRQLAVGQALRQRELREKLETQVATQKAALSHTLLTVRDCDVVACQMITKLLQTLGIQSPVLSDLLSTLGIHDAGALCRAVISGAFFAITEDAVIRLVYPCVAERVVSKGSQPLRARSPGSAGEPVGTLYAERLNWSLPQQ